MKRWVIPFLIGGGGHRHMWNPDTGLCDSCGTEHEHNWNIGHCDECGYSCPHESGFSYKYDYYAETLEYKKHSCKNHCGFATLHNLVKQQEFACERCTVCGAYIEHTFLDGTCTKCQYKCEHTFGSEHGLCVICGHVTCQHENVSNNNAQVICSDCSTILLDSDETFYVKSGPYMGGYRLKYWRYKDYHPYLFEGRRQRRIFDPINPKTDVPAQRLFFLSHYAAEKKPEPPLFFKEKWDPYYSCVLFMIDEWNSVKFFDLYSSSPDFSGDCYWSLIKPEYNSADFPDLYDRSNGKVNIESFIQDQTKWSPAK